MQKRKEGFVLVLFFLLVIIILTKLGSAALGISPAKIEINFVSGLETSVTYNVVSDDPDKELEIYALGELGKYITLDKKKLSGGGGFTAKLKLPDSIEKPGKHQIYVGAREKADEELAPIGTAIAIQALINVYVPYPGKYAELTLTANNANVNEPINFELEIINRGKETLNIQPKIEIYSGEEKKETLVFQLRELASQETINLKKILNTSSYNPGEYRAVAIVDYGETARAETGFKLGNLFVEIANYSRKIVNSGIQRFDVGVESRWNNKIEGVYAEVFINSISFKTPPATLEPWQKSVLMGFFNAGNFTEGKYPVNITVYYSGKSSNKLGEVEFIKKKSALLIWLIISVAFVLIVASVVLIRMRKNGAKKK